MGGSCLTPCLRSAIISASRKVALVMSSRAPPLCFIYLM